MAAFLLQDSRCLISQMSHRLVPFISTVHQSNKYVGINKSIVSYYCSTSAGGVTAASTDTKKKKDDDITDLPLNFEVPNSKFGRILYASVDKNDHETTVTTLNNGLRVASENKFGQFVTVGVAIDSGPRYESPFPSGIQHFLEKLAFSATKEFKDKDAILQALEKHGGICDCQGTRDTLLYAISAERKGLASMVNLLSEVVLRPKITDEELEMCRMAIRYELESLNMQPDPEPLLMEMIHAAAYGGNTLGLPKICTEASIEKIKRETILTYLHNYHQPSRMVLAGVGIEHDHLVDLAQKYFESKTSTWVEDSDMIDKSIKPDFSIAQYTGGLNKVEKDLSNVSLGPTPIPELAHIVIGLESSSHKDTDFVAFCVLNMMMGGGGSFSAGGPGKGMFTRLYTNVLNRHHWMNNATAYNHAYSDSGIFCIHASAHPSLIKDLSNVIIKEYNFMLSDVPMSELNRAKRQLQSMLLMNLESRPVAFEDVARQVLSTGTRHSAQFYFDEIEKVTSTDIHRVVTRMFRTKPAIAALGNLSLLHKFSQMQSALASGETRKVKKFSIFR